MTWISRTRLQLGEQAPFAWKPVLDHYDKYYALDNHCLENP